MIFGAIKNIAWAAHRIRNFGFASFANEFIHTVELAPFMMMERIDGMIAIADYTLAPEIPDQTDFTGLRLKINEALRKQSGEHAEEYYSSIIEALPILRETGSGIRWFRWLDTDVAEKMCADAEKAESLRAEAFQAV